jgi:aminoglycoside phosphotransferase
VNQVATFVEDHHEQLGLERLGIARRPSCVLLTPRFRRSRHIVVLVLARGEPVLVAKLPRLPGDVQALAREARNLEAVERALAGHDEGTAPALVAFQEGAAHPLLLETAVSGLPLSPAAIRRGRERIVVCVAAWVERLAAATLRTPADDAWYERLVSAPLRSLAGRGDAEVAGMVDRTRELAEPLRSGTLPLVFEHGDLAHPNLVRQPDGRLGVLDWERAEPAGLPAHDLFFFLAYAALAGRGGRRRHRDDLAELEVAFFGPRAWAWEVVERYALHLAIDAALLRPLLAVSCARAVAASLPPPSLPVGDDARRMMLLWHCALGGGG